jgi:hypothetical protein
LAVVEGEVDVVEGGVIREGVDGVNHLEALVDIWELLD